MSLTTTTTTKTTMERLPATKTHRWRRLTNRNTILDSSDEDEAACRSYFDKRKPSRPRPARSNRPAPTATASLVPSKRKTPSLPSPDNTMALPQNPATVAHMELPLHTKPRSPSPPPPSPSSSPLTTLPTELLQHTLLTLLLSHLHTPHTGDRDFLRTLLALTSTCRVLRIHAIAVLRMLRQEISVGGGLVKYVARPLEMRVVVLALDWRLSRVELGGVGWRGLEQGRGKGRERKGGDKKGGEGKDDEVRRRKAREERRKKDGLVGGAGRRTGLWDERYGCV